MRPTTMIERLCSGMHWHERLTTQGVPVES